MSILNEKNETTEKIIHILITELCDRDCKYCCNKQYDLHAVPYVTDEELRNAEILCLTGGEPFLYSQPNEIARYYKKKYPNIKKVYVYTNARELYWYLFEGGDLDYIDGLSISLKSLKDVSSFIMLKDDLCVTSLSSNLLYVFDNLYDEECEGFKLIHREWQEDFKPATDSIYRRM